MTISIWRYSHLALAVSSFLFLALASVTGVILAFKPITEKIQPYSVAGFDDLTLDETIPLLRKVYPEISSLTVDANHFVKIQGTDNKGEKLLAYADPKTGAILGVPRKESELFQWTIALHRSLFLHETGRVFVGITAFLLLLITVSGTILVVQRQRGVKRFFNKIAKDNFAQFYHVVLGRWSLVPILIISLSGTYLSVARFGLINTVTKSTEVDFDAIKSAPVRNATEFGVFKSIKLSEVQEVEFPFSDDAEDFYTLKLKDREVAVNQVTGEILDEENYPATVGLTILSLNLHTGQASFVWAVVLAIASANILFFIYSGFAITLKRRVAGTKNKFSAAESRYIILVGSENGNTFRFAQAVHQQLLKAGERSFLTELNDYKLYPCAEYLVVITATYGLGEAPTNASKFESLVQKFPQQQAIKYSVLGFGSHAYPDFCKYAFDVNHLLSGQKWASALTDIHTVDDRSPDELRLWSEAFAQQIGISLDALSEMTASHALQLQALTVSSNIAAGRGDGTFVVSFKNKKRLAVKSGDLLAIYPKNDYRERLYSIGVVDKEIRLSVRLHAGGIGSGFLHQLSTGQQIHAKIISNAHFHFPDQAKEVVMIANGTGIAPFLGMVSQNKKQISCQLYCGFRDNSSYQLYEPLLSANIAIRQLNDVQVAFSREGEKRYVSDLVARDVNSIAGLLGRGGVLMICGSLAMQKDVFELIDAVCLATSGKGTSYYQSHEQIRTDCY